MALFRCGSCLNEYEDHYPEQDTCIICNRGLIRIVTETLGQDGPAEGHRSADVE